MSSNSNSAVAALIEGSNWNFHPLGDDSRLRKTVERQDSWVAFDAAEFSNGNRMRQEHDLCALVPLRSTSRGISDATSVACNKSAFQTLVSIFNIPLKAVQGMFRRERGYFQYTFNSSLENEKGDKFECIQYELDPGSLEDPSLPSGPIQVIRTMNKSSHRFCILIFGPDDMLEKVDTLILSIHMDDTVTRSSKPGPMQLELEIFESMLEQWKMAHTFNHVTAMVTMAGMIQSAQVSLDANRLRESDQSLHSLRGDLGRATRLDRVLDELEQTCRQSEDDIFRKLKDDHLNPAYEVMRNLHQRINHGKETIQGLLDLLLTQRQTLTISIETRNATFIRTNTIALRRLAKQSQLETSQMQKMTENAVQDSHQMKKIAVLGMIYLPPTFAATFFSMPFLALDDNLGFKAWRRIYIYCILAATLSLVTFIGSLLMDRSSKTSATGDGENHSTDDNDDKVLEPDTVPEFTLAELMMRNIEMLDRPATLTEPHQPRTFDEVDPGDNVPSAGTDA